MAAFFFVRSSSLFFSPYPPQARTAGRVFLAGERKAGQRDPPALSRKQHTGEDTGVFSLSLTLRRGAKEKEKK